MSDDSNACSNPQHVLTMTLKSSRAKKLERKIDLNKLETTDDVYEQIVSNALQMLRQIGPITEETLEFRYEQVCQTCHQQAFVPFQYLLLYMPESGEDVDVEELMQTIAEKAAVGYASGILTQELLSVENFTVNFVVDDSDEGFSLN